MPENNDERKPKNYVEKAEIVVKRLKEDEKGKFLTTSKLRNLLSMLSEIYNDVQSEVDAALSKPLQDRINYLNVRMVYEAGREPSVKVFVSEAELLKKLNAIGDNKESFIEFYKYFEALVAYHRFYGGKDQ